MRQFNICGFMRSGQHAVHCWIISGFSPGSVEYLLKPWWDNKLATHSLNSDGNDLPDNLKPIVRNVIPKNRELVLMATEEIPLLYTDVLSGHKIFVIRSFPNLIASRYQYTIRNKNQLNGNVSTNLLEEYMAYLQLAATSTDKNTTFILYDKFVMSKYYRKHIAKRLSLNYEKMNMDGVASNGAGSSFIGLEKEMDTYQYVTRYKTLPKHLISLALDNTCKKLCCEVFGKELCQPMYAWLESRNKIQNTKTN